MVRNRSRARTGLKVLVAVVAVIFLVGTGVLGGWIFQAGTSNPNVPLGCDVTAVAEQDLPSVVTITATGSTTSGVGSGEVIRSDGYILTNNHVVMPAANGGSLRVLLADGRSASATIVGRDPLTDLAVIKTPDLLNLPVIRVSTAKRLRVGQPVVALGAPLGLSSTVTYGIVSALDRTVTVPGEGTQSALLINAIQTDAAINPGNSGGALVDCKAGIVGVPTAGASIPSDSSGSAGSIGLGFAIPIDLAERISDELIATGTVTRSYIGIQAAPIGGTAVGQAGPASGLFVTAVVPGGPAQAAGLRTGDVITELGGQAVSNTDQLVALLLSRRPGDRLDIAFERSGTRSTVTVTLGRQP